MHNKKSGGMTKIVLLSAVVGGVLAMIFSAFAAASLYKYNTDKFTSSLGSNLAALCSNSDLGLSKTQLRMIECADIRNVEYQTTDDGQKKFYAQVRLINPKVNCGSYSGDKPNEYLAEAVESLFDSKWNYVSCNIVGLCVDDKPVIDTETLQNIASCADESWNNGKNILGNKHIIAALNDALCPSPFKNRQYSDSTDYTLPYSRFLSKCSVFFADDGININGENSTQSPAIRKEIAKTLTPYFCSVNNLQINSSTEKKGIITLSFDSLNIIQSVSEAKSSVTSPDQFESTVMSAIVSDISNYSAEKTLNIKIDIDLVDFMSEDSEKALDYYSMIRAITEYYEGSLESMSTSSIVETPTSSKIISGESNGQWPVEFKRNSGDGNAVINIIQIYEDGTEIPVMKIFLADGSSQIVCLGSGKYRLNIAVGSNYFGAEQLFGNDGIYFKDTNIFEAPSSDVPSITVEKHSEENLSILDYMINKNINGTCIDQSDF